MGAIGVAGLTASGADLVKPGGSGTAGEAEEEEASWSSTAQRRARPLPFSIAAARGSTTCPAAGPPLRASVSALVRGWDRDGGRRRLLLPSCNLQQPN